MNLSSRLLKNVAGALVTMEKTSADASTEIGVVFPTVAWFQLYQPMADCCIGTQAAYK